MVTAKPSEEIKDVINRVTDPCSDLMGSGVSLADMGMIEDIRVGDKQVEVELLLDDPSCPYLAIISDEIRHVVHGIDESLQVIIRLNNEKLWTPNRVTDHGNEVLDRRRKTQLDRLPIVVR